MLAFSLMDKNEKLADQAEKKFNQKDNEDKLLCIGKAIGYQTLISYICDDVSEKTMSQLWNRFEKNIIDHIVEDMR